MKNRNRMKATLATVAALLGITLSESSAHGFSTGGHFTATERGLRRAGFDINAIRHVQAANYTIDHVVNLPSAILKSESVLQRASNVARYFHFDGLWHTGYVEREFAFVDTALKKYVVDAKGRRDSRAILSAIGIASHAIQDFYSHSNFADVDWKAWKGARIVTMDDAPRDVWENPLLTGRWARPDDVKRLLSGQASTNPFGGAPEPNYPSHGDADKQCTTEGQRECGLNHDGARRRNNLVAIMMAAEATFDLVERVKGIVDDATLWNSVMYPGVSEGTNGAWERAHMMSMAAGQWGYESSKNYVQIGIAAASTARITTWEVTWWNVLSAMWLAAPTAHAMGGGADPFPANNVQLFGIPAAVPAPGSAYAGAFSVLWGTKRGTLELTTDPSQRLDGTLTIDQKTYKQTAIFTRNGGLAIEMHGPDRTVLTGIVYVTGATRDLSGYLRDGVSGVPDGFAATKLKRDEVLPVKPNTVKAF